DTYTPEATIVHFTISKNNLQNIAERVVSEGRTPDKAVFALSPPTSEVRISQVAANSENYKVAFTWPEEILPQQPVTFGIRITDNSDQPLNAATYEFVIMDGNGVEVTRAGGVTTPEGVSSQDVTFNTTGSFTVRVDKIRGTSESIQSSVTVVPEFPASIAAIAAALAIGGVIAAKRTALFGKTY